ncbi:HIT family protein [Labilithrix luteola]|nr:HIT domain-containing protein [Labilithrix luteola]
MKPNLFIRETEHAVCVLNAFGSMPSDMLVVAKRHLPTLAEVPWEVHEDMSRLAWEAGRVLERRGAKRVYLAQLGSPADIPTSYAHAHVHVIPVTTTDESARPAVVLSWSSGVIAYDPGEGEALAASLAASFQESPSTVTGTFRRSKFRD